MDVWVSGQFSDGGSDIGEAPFPTNDVDVTKLGATGSVLVFPALSLNLAAFTVVDGRNVSLSNAFSLGITYRLAR